MPLLDVAVAANVFRDAGDRDRNVAVLSEQLAASASQTKQIALRLVARGYAQRGGGRGSTRLTPEGRALAARAALLLDHEMLDRLTRDDPVAIAHGAAKLQALYNFAYGLSHEINNPLANISARAQTLLLDEKNPERRRKLATIVQQASEAS